MGVVGVVVVGLAAPAVEGTAVHAQEAQGVVGNLRVESSAPGVLVVSWEAPGLEPTDYRVAWAEASLEFLSYASANEAQRGNEYPSGEATSLTLSDLNPGATYKVQMRARYSDGDYADEPWSGPWTAEQALRVRDHRSAAPSGLVAAAAAGGASVSLTWVAPSDEAISGYRILRGPEVGSLTELVADTASTATAYLDTAVRLGAAYLYQVVALSRDGDSAASETAPVTLPPAAPTGLRASPSGHDTVTLTWTAPAGGAVSGYRVLRGPPRGPMSVLEDDTASTDTRYTDTTVAAQTTYVYAVAG